MRLIWKNMPKAESMYRKSKPLENLNQNVSVSSDPKNAWRWPFWGKNWKRKMKSSLINCWLIEEKKFWLLFIYSFSSDFFITQYLQRKSSQNHQKTGRHWEILGETKIVWNRLYETLKDLTRLGLNDKDWNWL